MCASRSTPPPAENNIANTLLPWVTSENTPMVQWQDGLPSTVHRDKSKTPRMLGDDVSLKAWE